MPSTFRTESIVIKKEPWREYDRLYTLYTREAGKIQAVARGSRRFQSRMAAHLEPFIITDVMIARGRQIDKLAGSERIHNFTATHARLEGIALMTYCFEVLDKLISAGQPDERIFNLTRELMEIVEQNHLLRERSFMVARIFSLKLLGFLGYEPELSRCLDCRKEAEGEGYFFNAARGGVVCPVCSERLGGRILGQIAISGEAINTLREFTCQGFTATLESYIMPQTARVLDLAIDEFLKYHLDRELKSEAYFYEVFA
ncbi:MAG: DNA repair protein RecO [Patescibacteria group bacterium]|nr:DNA repair protein RecO [Patescibacteria group bacterium]